MDWNMIQKRWNEFLNVLREQDQNQTSVKRTTATPARDETALKMQDRRDDENSLFGHGRVG